ncbi:hypothetical protein Tco_1348884, partial [Tanacetum coccineum]
MPTHGVSTPRIQDVKARSRLYPQLELPAADPQ